MNLYLSAVLQGTAMLMLVPAPPPLFPARLWRAMRRRSAVSL